jgi:hypothetical protein
MQQINGTNHPLLQYNPDSAAGKIKPKQSAFPAQTDRENTNCRHRLWFDAPPQMRRAFTAALKYHAHKKIGNNSLPHGEAMLPSFSGSVAD